MKVIREVFDKFDIPDCCVKIEMGRFTYRLYRMCPLVTKHVDVENWPPPCKKDNICIWSDVRAYILKKYRRPNPAQSTLDEFR